MEKANLKLGEILLYSGKIKSEQLDIAVREQKNSSLKIGEILTNKSRAIL